MRRALSFLLLIIMQSCLAVAGARASAETAASGAGGEKPSLRIVGASPTEGIKLNRNSAAFKYVFTVEATQEQIAGVRVTVAPFSGPDGALAETQCVIDNKPCNAEPVNVPALGAFQVEVTATLPLEGNYASAVTLTYDGRRETTPFSVARTRRSVPVEVLGIETVRADPLLRSGPVVVWLTLSGTPGAEGFKLQPPTPVALALEGPNNAKLQAPIESLTLTDEKGEPVSGEFSLRSGETRRYKLSIGGLDDAGQYTGTLRIAALDAQPVDKPIAIVVKAAALYAALLIGLGVLAGYLLRRYATRDRPRLIQQRRLLILVSEVATLEREIGQINDAERGVFTLIRRWIDDIYEDVQAGLAKDADAAVVLLDQKLTLIPLWVNMRRRVDAVRPAGLAEPFRAKLDTIRDFLREKQPGENALIEVQGALDAMPDQITKVVKDDLIKRLGEFKGEVDKLRAATSDLTILDALRGKVEPAIARATADAQAERFDSARAAFDEARLQYARLLAESLRAGLENEPAPLGLDDTNGKQLKSEVVARLDEVSGAADPDAAIATYRAAYASYLRRITEALRGEVKEDLATLKAQEAKLEEAFLIKHAGSLNQISRLLDDTARHLDAGELPEAVEKYKRANAALKQALVEMKAGGVPMSAPAAAADGDALPAGVVPDSAGELPAVYVLPRQPRGRQTVKALTRRLWWFDLGFELAVLFAAVALGLSLLWVNNPTWGNWADSLTAVLWGLGLHQVAGASFDPSGLREKFAAPPAPSQPGGQG